MNIVLPKCPISIEYATQNNEKHAKSLSTALITINKCEKLIKNGVTLNVNLRH